MDLPANLKEATFHQRLKRGTIFRLKGNRPFPSESYHLFVVLNYDPQKEKILLLVNGTSQVKKRWDAIERTGRIDAGKTTVFIRAGTYSFITKDTLFNCNEVHEINVSDLDFNSDAVKNIQDELSEVDIEKMVQAALASPLVSQYKKNCLLPPRA